MSVADPYLQIRGRPGHPDPEIRWEGRGLKEIVFRPFGPQFGLKIGRGRAPQAPPLDPSLIDCLWN